MRTSQSECWFNIAIKATGLNANLRFKGIRELALSSALKVQHHTVTETHAMGWDIAAQAATDKGTSECSSLVWNGTQY